MAKRKVIPSLRAFIQLAQSTPALKNIPAFQVVRPVIDKYLAKAGCSCNKNDILRSGKSTFEGALAQMTEADKTELKRLLQSDEVCYYCSGVGTTLQLKCI